MGLRELIHYFITLQLLLACWLMCFSFAVSAKDENNIDINVNQLDNNPLNLDLSSTSQSIPAQDLTSPQPIIIDVGGATRAIVAHDNLTPAEYLAALQVITGGKQSIQLGSLGNAIGGSFALASTINQPIGSLIVPSGVTAIQDFGVSKVLQLDGNFVNSGNFYAVSTNSQINNATLTANNIINQQGGLLTSIIPAQGLAGYSHLIQQLNFNLIAINEITNYGSITSSGNLNMIASNAIVNANIGNITAVMQAANSVNMVAANITNQGQITANLNNVVVTTNNLINSGRLEALAGNLNIQNLLENTLTINNTAGLIAANNNLVIEIDHSSILSQLNILGGTLRADNLSLSVKKGTLSASLQDISGEANLKADQVFFQVNNGTNGLNIKGLNKSDVASLLYYGVGDISFKGFDTDGGLINITTLDGSIKVNGSLSTSPPRTGTGGNIDLNAGQSITVGKINTAGHTVGDGGNITLTAGRSITAKQLNASGGAASGKPGIISIHAGTNGSGDISLDSIIVSGQASDSTISLTSPDTVNVTDNIFAPGTTLYLNSANNNIGGIDVGQGKINLVPLVSSNSYNVDFAQLSKYATESLQIGNSSDFTSDIVVSKSCDHCLSNLKNITIDTKGKYSGSGTTLELAPDASFRVTASSGISTGSITGGGSLSFQTQGNLLVDGNLNSPNGTINLNSDINFEGATTDIKQGTNILGSSIIITSGKGNISSGGNLQASAGTIAIHSGHALSLLDSSQLTAKNGITLTAKADMVIGSANNIDTGGSIVLDSYLDGQGSGKIAIGDNVTIAASGDSTKVGDIGFHSAQDINIGRNCQLTSKGGDIWLNAASNIIINPGTQVSSYATIDNNDQTPNNDGIYEIKPAYWGGGIAIMAGAPDASMSAKLAEMAALRTGNDTISLPTGPSFDTISNTINLSGGSTLEVVLPENAHKSVSNSSFNLSGGAIFIDPPDLSHSVDIFGVQFTVVGPPIAPPIVNAAAPNSAFLTNVNDFNLASTSGVPTNTTTTSAISTQTLGSALASSNTAISFRDAADSKANSLSNLSLRPATYCMRPTCLSANNNSDENSWIIAAGGCEPFSFETEDGSLIVATGANPAKFAPSINRTLLLKEGKILLITTETVLVIKTPLCSTTIPVNSAVTVEYQPTGLTRITNFAGGKASTTVSHNDETVVLSASPGEQLVLEEVVAQEIDPQVFPLPDIHHERLNSYVIDAAGVRGEKFGFDRREMLLREPLLSCTRGCLSAVHQKRVDEVLNEMKQTSSDASSHASQKPKVISNSHLRPVSFMQGANMAGAISSRINTFNAGTATIKYTSATQLGVEKPGTLLLANGSILIASSKVTTVKAGNHVINLCPHTIALVSLHDDLLTIRNIYEAQPAAVSVLISGQRRLGLLVGQELIVGQQGISLTQALSGEPAGRRHLTSFDIANTNTIVHSEISLISLLQNTDVLSELVRSHNPGDKSLASKIMKMAVCLTIVTGNRGNYSMTGQ